MSEHSNGPRSTKPVSGRTHGKDAAEGALAKAEQMAEVVKDKAKAAVVGVGETMSGMGESLREHAPEAIAPYAEKAASSLEQAGEYLQQGTIGGVVDDLSEIVRRHPVPAVLSGIVLGFVLARKMQR